MLTWLAKPMWTAPYVFRAVRLRQIYMVTEMAFTEDKPATRRSSVTPEKTTKRNFMIRESNLVVLLLTFLTPFLVLTVLMSVYPKFAFLMPFFCISQCQGKTRNEYWDYINRTMQIVMVGYFIINVVLFICLFIIRNVSSVFSARQELKQVVAVLVVAFGVEIASLLYLDETMYVVMGYFLYVNLLASVTCLYLTALGPIRNTYKTSSIIPFSLN